MSTMSQFFGGGSASVPIGGVVQFVDVAPTTVTSGTNVYLRSGNVSTGEAATYPDAYASFSRKVINPADEVWPQSGLWQNAWYVASYIPSLNSFIAAGYAGSVALSSNGTSWYQYVSTATSGELYAAAYGNGLYIVGGQVGIWSTSTDGKNWVERSVFTGGDAIRSLVYANSLWVAGCSGGKIYTSTDGLTWVLRTANFATQTIFSVIWTGTQFVAGGGSGYISTSPDGITWTNRRASGNQINSMYYNGSIIVAGGAGGSIVTSTDGITWTSRTSNFNASYSIYSVYFFNGLFMAAGGFGLMVTSPDGITWTARTTNNANSDIYVVTANSTNAVYFGAGRIGVSTNATTWTSTVTYTSTDYYSCAYGNGVFVAVGAGGNLFSSPDGAYWTPRTSQFGINDIYRVRFLNNQFVAVGAPGRIATSSDGITWTLKATGLASNANLTDVTYGPAGYIVIPNVAGSSYLWSLDLTTFVSKQFSGTSYTPLTAAYYAGSYYIGLSGSGILFTSPTGIGNWTYKDSKLGSVRQLAYGNGVFVAAPSATSTTISVSVDGGNTWTARDAQTLAVIRDVAYGAGVFVATGDVGVGGVKVGISYDGVNWTSAPGIAVSYGNNFIAYGNNIFVGGGYSFATSTDPLVTGVGLPVRSGQNDAVDYMRIK